MFKHNNVHAQANNVHSNAHKGPSGATTKLNVQPHQQDTIPRGNKFNFVTLNIPSQSQPTVNGSFIIDLKVKNIMVHDLLLQWNVTATNCVLTPTPFWIDHIDIMQNSVILDTIYGEFSWLLQQMFNPDTNRTALNYAEGNYLDETNTANLYNQPNSIVYTNISCLINQCHLSLLTPQHDIQLRIYTKNQDAWINQSITKGGGGTPSIAINSVQLLVKATELSADIAQSELLSLTKTPKHYMYHSTLNFLQTVNSGVTNVNLTLTSITNNVVALFLVIRPASFIGAEAYDAFMKIKQFELLSAQGQNIMGGSPFESTYDLLEYIPKHVNNGISTFTSESYNGTNQSYVYCYSFANNLLDAIKHGSYSGSRTFNGSEQLKLQFDTALTSAIQINVYAIIESALDYSPTKITKLLIN